LLVVQEIEKSIKAHISPVDNKASSYSSILAERQVALQAAEERQKEASTALKTSEADLPDLEMRLEKAQKESHKAAFEVKHAQTDLDLATSFLAKFQDGLVAAFHSLDAQVACRLLARGTMGHKGPELCRAGHSSPVVGERSSPIIFRVGGPESPQNA